MLFGEAVEEVTVGSNVCVEGMVVSIDSMEVVVAAGEELYGCIKCCKTGDEDDKDEFV